MELDLTFKAVCGSLKKGGDGDSKLIEAVDTLLGLTIICAPVALGAASVGLLSLLRVKDELTKIGQRVFRAATKKQTDDYLARLGRMRTAHGLLVYTAFFEALDKAIPKDILKRVDLQAEERRAFAERESEPGACRPKSESRTPAIAQSNPLAEVPIGFPHPTQSLQQQVESHQDLWRQLSDGFGRFIQMLAFWDDMKEKQKKDLRKTIEGIPAAAAQIFVAQYLELSRRFPDFAIWANLHQHEATSTKLSTLASCVREYAALWGHSRNAVDLGLEMLHQAINDLPDQASKADATGILEGLARHYAARLNDPIIEDKEGTTGDGPQLRFPKVREAFVPQPFRVVRVTKGSLHLEDEKTWVDLPQRDDLGPFLLSYFLSPYSTESPLLVLGHPGSGKSLLTKVLAAQLAARHNSVVRVPLREVDADVGIVAQIEDAIGQVTKRRVDSWARLSAAFRDQPPVVILDGYDELLQASGRVYAGYLRDVKAFQQSEAEQGRPVRVVVTSRVTLIDKAMVPVGATVLRLLEFDTRRQEEWISVWNGANASYFQEVGIEEFRLPAKDQVGAEKILSLAEQPLLLLMLALYDSQDNQLRKSMALDRTRLYDELLRRFVTRERRKDRSFEHDQTPQEQKVAIDNDMRRLGVAAIGMYNRRQVHILADELEADLRFFDLLKEVTASEGRPMSQADLLLGSFFFVHKSQAKTGTDDGGAAEAEASAFEFLHNTLGEFLTADFILRWAIDEVQALAALKDQEALRSVFHEKLNSPDGLRRQWFASLVYTPLFTRPVVLEMMREWSGHLLRDRHMSREVFAAHLDMVLHNQIERLISKRAMPSIMLQETVDERYRARFGDHPLVGHIAVYSVNLILLRVIVCNEPFVMDESVIKSYEDGARPWDRLVHIWRSWFSLEALSGLTAVIESDRKANVVEVRAKSTFQVAEARGRLEILLNVSMAVADDLTAAVSGLAHSEVASSQALGTRELAQRLTAERIESAFQLAIRDLQEEVRGGDPGIEDLVQRGGRAMDIAIRERPRDDVERVASLFAAGVRSAIAGPRPQETESPSHWVRHHADIREALGPSVQIRFVALIMERSPEAALTWLRAVKLIPGAWVFRGPEAAEVVESLVHGGPPMWDVFRESPTSAAAWVDVLREVGLPLWSRGGPRGFFERFFHPGMMMEMIDRSPESALAFLEAVLGLDGGSERFWGHMEPEVMQRLLDPRYLLDLAERNPGAGISIARFLRQWGSGRFSREMALERREGLVRGFIEHAGEMSFLFELMERSPEVALEVVRIVRSLGGRDAVRGFLHTSTLERLLQGRDFLYLLERRPQSLLAVVQIFREVGREVGVDSDLVLRLIEPEVLQRLLDPRYFLDLSDRSPAAATALVRLLREWADPLRGAETERVPPHKVVQEFIEHIAGTPLLLELTDRSPETALEVVRLVRAFGGREARRRQWHPGMLERLSDGRLLLRLSERSPEASAAMIQLLRELAGDSMRFWRHMEPQVAQHVLDPHYLLDLTDRSPQAASSFIRFLREFADERMNPGKESENLHGAVRKFIERVATTPFLLDVMDRSSETALEILRLIRTLGGRESLMGLGRPGMLGRLVDRRAFLQMSERSSEAAIVLAELLRDSVGGSGRKRHPSEGHLAEELLDPGFLIRLSEHSPSAALILMAAARDVAFDPGHHGRGRPFRGSWDPRHLETILTEWLSRPSRDPRGFAAALSLARLLRSQDALRKLAEALAESLGCEVLGVHLPLAALDDIHWLASQDAAGDVRGVLLRTIPDAPPPGAKPAGA